MNSQKDTKSPEMYATINGMNSFTPHFLQAIDSVGGLGVLVDAAVMEGMFNDKSLLDNMYESIRDHGYEPSEARQNADCLAEWVETGVYTTNLTRSRYNFPSKRVSPAR
jgi:hypothetical protein